MTASPAGRTPTPILYCIDRLVYGGTEKQLIELVRGLDRGLFDPVVCTLKPSAVDLAELRCPVVELPFRSFGHPSIVRCLARFRRVVAEHRIEIVQGFFQDATILAFLASRGTRVRRVFGSFRDLGFWRTWKKNVLLRSIYPHFDGFIANSRAVALNFHRVDRVPLERIRVIHNGLPPLEATPPDARLAAWRPDHPVAGIVANLDREVKRVDLFVDAACRVLGRVPEARFVVVGDGHLRAALERQALDAGARDAFLFTGNVADVRPLLAGLDAGVLCSESEGLSNAILEYMRSGVPVVATNVGGNPEIVEDGENGFLVPPGDPARLAEAMVRILSDPALSGRMSAAARQTALTRFSLERYIREHERYYRESLGEFQGAEALTATTLSR